jgi:apolipoprotein D and lipocalin family protein
MRCLVLLVVLALAACGQNPVYRHVDDPLPVAHIDQQRYLGHWHEQARLPNSFERGCQRVTADYAARADGLIAVRNTCIEASGAHRVAEGRARPAGAHGEGKLEVSFFGPFWSKYWVIEHADDYSWAIVGEPEGRFLWLLTRAETIAPEDRIIFEARIRALGYRPDDMEWATPARVT